MAHKPVRDSGKDLVFGDFLVDKKVETNWKCNTGGYYTLEALWFVLSLGSAQHGSYIVEARKKDIQIVTLLDKKGIIAYLNGQTDTNPNIDVMKVGIVALARKRPADTDRGEVVKRNRMDDPLKRRSIIETGSESGKTAEKIKPLSEKLTRDKIAELKSRVAAKRQKEFKPATEKDSLQQHQDQDTGPMREILQRERPLRTRETILISKGKSFEPVLKILENVKAKEDAAKKAAERAKQPMYNRYETTGQDVWKEHGAATDEFQIDTMGGFLSRPKAPEAPIRSSGPVVPPRSSRPEKPQKDATVPIIVVPNSLSSLIHIHNAKAFLENLHFMNAEEVAKEKEAKGKAYKKPSKVLIYRPTGTIKVPYQVVDDTTHFTEHDWKRVVGCFTYGAKWQFKGWPWGGDPAAIFGCVMGAHLMLDDRTARMDDNIKTWAVQVLKVNRTKRYLDKTAALMFWNALDEFWAKRQTHVILK